MDTFHPWPSDALQAVGMAKLQQGLEKAISDDVAHVSEAEAKARTAGSPVATAAGAGAAAAAILLQRQSAASGLTSMSTFLESLPPLNHLVQFLSAVHMSVSWMAAEVYSRQRITRHVTPRVFLSMCDTFLVLYVKQRQSVQNRLVELRNGIDKIRQVCFWSKKL